ncbi:hypothetical protein OED01_06740 [Microbacterium sp. M28]|uniref:hypothetical protein n=1 Tax=Microbacterium sp. M28 TaxID=2962064 RepID=UPI0021F4A537|nr:hypothetical protein [Microbacterium sp. M28]UYO98402.1 hypothetical protein OED01_06740 [Microbacterium sp. M28]
MTSDPDDALSWEGDEDRPAHKPSLPQGWNAVGRGSEQVATEGELSSSAAATAEAAPDEADQAEAASMSPAMLLFVGVFGGIYLLYAVGWFIGGLNLKPLANLIVADAMYVPWFVLAVAAPALWMLTVWVLTRGAQAWIRVLLLLAGAVLLVPWPFVMVGAVGS